MFKVLEYLYFLIAAVEIFCEISGNESLRFFAKPLLMIVLIAFYAQSINGKWNAIHKTMIVAFAFSWVGDVALMFVGESGTSLMGIPKNPNWFLVGLVGFLVTHILYTLSFAKVSYPNNEGLLPKKIWVFIPLAIYMAALLSMLVPSINGNAETQPFLIPVLIYSSAIAIMVVFAMNRFRRVNDKSFALVFAGALLFMFSDSIIAINKFMYSFETAGIFIMVLYIAGQYFIAKGMLAQNEA